MENNTISNEIRGQLLILIKNKLALFLDKKSSPIETNKFKYNAQHENLFYSIYLSVKGNTVNLVRWHDDVINYDIITDAMKYEGYSDSDLYILETFLSRLGYLFCIDLKSNDREFNLIYLIYQITYFSNYDSKEIAVDKTDLLHCFLCELFFNYEQFSKFSLNSQGLWLHPDNQLGSRSNVKKAIKVNDLLLNLHKQSSNISNDLMEFHLAVVEILFGCSSDKKDIEMSLDLSKRFSCKLIDPKIFLSQYQLDSDVIFSAINQWSSHINDPKEDFIRSILIQNFMFYILRKSSNEIIKLKDYIDDDDKFSDIIGLILKRRIMLPKNKLLGLGIDDIVNKYF